MPADANGVRHARKPVHPEDAVVLAGRRPLAGVLISCRGPHRHRRVAEPAESLLQRLQHSAGERSVHDRLVRALSAIPGERPLSEAAHGSTVDGEGQDEPIGHRQSRPQHRTQRGRLAPAGLGVRLGEWYQHRPTFQLRSADLDSDHLLRALTLLPAARAEVDALETGLLFTARSAGLTWAQIADAMGFNSPQACQQHFNRLTARNDSGS